MKKTQAYIPAAERNVLHSLQKRKITHKCTRGTLSCDGSVDIHFCRYYQYLSKRNLAIRSTIYHSNNRIWKLIRQYRGIYKKDHQFNRYRDIMNTHFLRECLTKLQLADLFPSVFERMFLCTPYDARLVYVKSLFRYQWFIMMKHCIHRWYSFLDRR